MKCTRLIFPFVFLTFYVLQLSAQPLSPRTANYKIELTLNVDEKKVDANQTIFFRNPSGDTIRDLQLHLYYNAFKNTNSTFYQDQDGFSEFGNFEKEDLCTWSWMNVLGIMDEEKNNLTEGMNFISPDDDNSLDQTVLSIPLQTPILPFDSASFNLIWQSKIPNVRPRTGYNKDFYFFVQWFPKLGVYEPAGTRYAKEGGWNCHQYHASGEYYADFGNYEVSMTVPKNFEVGASGKLMNKKENDQVVTHVYKAHDVIDFAWTCSPKFRVIEDRWESVDLRILTYDEHAACAERYFSIIKNAFTYLDKHVGKYPYSTFTLVDPPLHGMFVGGMEYPTLITSLNLCFLPPGLKTTETLTTHELIHQYFMQMVATHEVEEPWLDEGFTTYYEGRILDHYHGKQTSFVDWQGLRIGNGEYNRGEFFSMRNPKIANNTFKSWEFKHGGYGPVSYNKTAVWLKTLEGMVGVETMDKIMQTYFERWKFKHPCGRNFEEVANEVVLENHGDKFGDNLNWFFDQVIRSSKVCDYQVASIENIDVPYPSGFLDNLEDCEKTDLEKTAKSISRVTLNRLGELKFPQEVQINFADGSTKMEFWDGQKRSFDFTYIDSEAIVSVNLDPERKIYLDKDFSNNSKAIENDTNSLRYYLHQFISAAQNTLLSLSLLI